MPFKINAGRVRREVQGWGSVAVIAGVVFLITHLVAAQPEWTLARALEVGALVAAGSPFLPDAAARLYQMGSYDRSHPQPAPSFRMWGQVKLLGWLISTLQYLGYAGLVWALAGHSDEAIAWIIGAAGTLAYWAIVIKLTGWKCLRYFALAGAVFAARGIYGLANHGGVYHSDRLSAFLLVLGATMVVTTTGLWLATRRGSVATDAKAPFVKLWNYLGGGEL